MKHLFNLSIILLFSPGLLSQQEKLAVDGAIVISNSNISNPSAGAIRWTGSDFQGFNGAVWMSLTSRASNKASVNLLKTGVLMDQNGNGIAEVGETITYSYFITNTGRKRLTNVVVTDPQIVIAGVPLVLSPCKLDNSSFSGIYLITQDDVDNGIVINQSTVSGIDPDNNIVTYTDDEDTPLN